MPPLLNMIARVGNDLCPLGLRNEWLSPCAASTLPSVGLEICASCATRGTCIRTHLLPTACREVAITSFGDHLNASITRSIAGCVPFFILIQSGERPARYGRSRRTKRPRRTSTGSSSGEGGTSPTSVLTVLGFERLPEIARRSGTGNWDIFR
jgi:hypothetical protein